MDNKKSRCCNHRDGKEANMKCVKGIWYFKGIAYPTFRAALEAAWANR